MLELKDKWIWDFWFCQDGTDFHLFYLQAPRSLGNERLRHHNATIGHAQSRDLQHWIPLPTALGPGKEDEWDDLATWTGSVIRKGDRWYLLYTGVSKAEKGLVQRIGLAVSEDLIHWKKHSGNPILEADGRWYELLDLDAWHDQAWRDPWVFKFDGRYHAMITARANVGPADGRGVIGHAFSDDLLEWRVGPPLTTPGDFGQLEVPQLIEVQDHNYLVFSTDRFSHSKAYLQRTGAQPATGTGCYVGETPLGPFLVRDQPWLFADEHGQRYSGKFLEANELGWTFMAFENYDSNGEFIGRILDPFILSKTD